VIPNDSRDIAILYIYVTIPLPLIETGTEEARHTPCDIFGRTGAHFKIRVWRKNVK